MLVRPVPEGIPHQPRIETFEHDVDQKKLCLSTLRFGTACGPFRLWNCDMTNSKIQHVALLVLHSTLPRSRGGQSDKWLHERNWHRKMRISRPLAFANFQRNFVIRLWEGFCGFGVLFFQCGPYEDPPKTLRNPVAKWCLERLAAWLWKKMGFWIWLFNWDCSYCSYPETRSLRVVSLPPALAQGNDFLFQGDHFVSIT